MSFGGDDVDDVEDEDEDDALLEELDDEVLLDEDDALGFNPSARAFSSASTNSDFSKKLLVEMP